MRLLREKHPIMKGVPTRIHLKYPAAKGFTVGVDPRKSRSGSMKMNPAIATTTPVRTDERNPTAAICSAPLTLRLPRDLEMKFPAPCPKKKAIAWMKAI